MTTIKVSPQQVSSDAAYRDVATVISPGCADEINASTAVTIAAWWQSPGGIGRWLASFASGCEVDRSALLDDIAATRNAHGYSTGAMEQADRDALDCLATFVMHH